MIPIPSAFSPSYAAARAQFLAAAEHAGLPVQSHIHPLPGCEGEELAMDVALDGRSDSKQLLIISSACHGVEGFCGSGVQVYALHDEAWRAAARAAGVAVLYLHALNPWGFSHKRRVTHEGVDLNRNFRDFDQPLPINTGYAQIHPLLLPKAWPPDEANRAAIRDFMAQHGQAAWQEAISSGQCQFPEGLFYGGQAPTWSHRTVRQVLAQYASGCQRVAWIDLHTGLGPNGVGERIYAGRNDGEAIARARRWWGSQVTSIYDGSSSSAPLTGLMWECIHEAAPQAEYTGIAMEYGTEPLAEMLDALRGDHWLALHPNTPEPLASSIRARMLNAFYTDNDNWKTRIVEQARESFFQAIEGLSFVK